MDGEISTPMRELLKKKGKYSMLYNTYIDCVAKLAVMHDLCLIHTDLKPENILFTSPEYVKVPDYKVFLLSQCPIFR